VYDFNTRIEIGRYVGEHDDLIDFYEDEEPVEEPEEGSVQSEGSY
jgi:hypothetical protein